MFWFGCVVGGLIVGTVVAIIAILYIVIGGLTRAGDYKAQWGELWRQWAGARWEDAEILRAARRQARINQEVARIEQRRR
jgi:hypothetical protein